MASNFFLTGMYSFCIGSQLLAVCIARDLNRCAFAFIEELLSRGACNWLYYVYYWAKFEGLLVVS